MQTIAMILTLLCAVVASGGLGRMLPFGLPLPLVQIALGAALAWALGFGVPLEPDMFLLLFLPPLLFLDGWRLPKDELLRDARGILGLAFGLVVTTVIGLGLFIHWLIPAMPQPVAFALAAVLSPTDPVAVSGIAARVPFPKRLMRILEGESLLNDASGLVCLRFAVAAAVTGAFSLPQALVTFLWLAGGGLAAGVTLAWLVSTGFRAFGRRFGVDEGTSILVSLLVPFGAYLAAEHIHASGILAAVGAGVTMGLTEDLLTSPAEIRIRRGVVWDMVRFAANGAIFVILGEQLPGILAGAATTVQQAADDGSAWRNPAWLGLYVAAIYLVLAGARFAWAWLWLQVSIMKRRRRGKAAERPGWQLIAATALAGVKGTVTLAGILTLPFMLPDHSPFPARDLAIFLAAGVIVVSLAVAAAGLPALLKGLEFPADDRVRNEIAGARDAADAAAIQAVGAAAHKMGEGREDADLYAQAGARLMARYRERLSPNTESPEEAGNQKRLRAIGMELLRVGIRAERRAVLRLRRQRKIGEEAMHAALRQIDLAETRLER
jgi:CPA1 family monovalent cation:H+ antiporter